MLWKVMFVLALFVLSILDIFFIFTYHNAILKVQKVEVCDTLARMSVNKSKRFNMSVDILSSLVRKEQKRLNNASVHTSAPDVSKEPKRFNKTVHTSAPDVSKEPKRFNKTVHTSTLLINKEQERFNMTTQTPASKRVNAIVHTTSAMRYSRFLKQDAIINPHNYTYVINRERICHGKEIQLAICVPVRRHNFQERMVVRKAWGSFALDKNNKAILLFFMGIEAPGKRNEFIEREIRKESSIHKDIIQEDFIDSYQNLSLKTVSILKWVTKFCPNVKFLLKADDDMYVNVPNLMSALRGNGVKSFQNKFVMGMKRSQDRPIADVHSKWHTPRRKYAEKYYPAYVSGTAYAMTGPAAALLYAASLRTPLFWLEDVYVTGLCARKAGVPVLHNSGMASGRPPPTGCHFKNAITGHYLTSLEIMRIHEELNDPLLNC